VNLKDIANELVAGCRENRAAGNLAKLYADDAVSVEAADNSGAGRVSEGLDAIRGKHAWWDENFEVHDASVSDPMLHGDDRFAVIFGIDATMKSTGDRSQMKEVAIYHVADGQIVREEFFY
jgi:ketosteroid isomerase-like protein